MNDRKNLWLGLTAAAWLITATGASAAEDRQLNLRVLDFGPATSSEATATDIPGATVVASRTLVGSDADIAHDEVAIADGRFEIELAPGSDAQHRSLKLKYLSEGVDAEGHQTRSTIAVRPREFETGKPLLVRIPSESRYALEVCTGQVGDCPNAVERVSLR